MKRPFRSFTTSVRPLVGYGSFVLVLAGCVPGPTPPQFAGLYDVTRGTTKLKIGWSAGQAQGESTQESSGGELEPIDPNVLPAVLRPLAETWNSALDDFNAGLGAVFPNQVLISHPGPYVVKVESPNDPNEFFQGLNTPDGFLAVQAGATPVDPNTGIGAIGASTVTGKWDGEDTVTGEWSLSLTLGGRGQVLILAIVVPYDAIRVSEE
jgi:hypothetical protein